MEESMVRIVCAVVAVLFLGMIVLRRRKTVDGDDYPNSPDLVEYVLMAGFVMMVATAILPGLANTIIHLLERINEVIATATAMG